MKKTTTAAPSAFSRSGHRQGTGGCCLGSRYIAILWACLAQQFLHDDAIAPCAIQPGMPLIHADLPEAKAPAQGAAGRVLRKDAGDELPEAALRTLIQQALQHGASDPHRARGTSDVHREFRDAGVTGAGTVGTGSCPCHHLPVTLDDDGRVSVAALGQLGLDLLHTARL